MTHQKGPVFIHALFRSGSTYLYQAFRRLGNEYTCFQEPLHEIAVKARENPSILNDDQDPQKAEMLRHPSMSQPYFSELYQVAEEVLPCLNEEDVYQGYFSSGTACRGLKYWQALIDSSAGRPVIQECRSAGRIGALHQSLGGFHLYLWRNPWDQWWSYQVSPYFDLTSQMILNAETVPPEIRKVREHIGFEPLPGKSLLVTQDWFANRPLSPDNAYIAFYALWLHALKEAISHADLLVNIDELSANEGTRRSVVRALAQEGIQGLCLDDCISPASVYSLAEERHFLALEEQVHQLFLAAGVSGQVLDELLALRKKAAPARDHGDKKDLLQKDLARYRDLLRRRQEELADLHIRSDAALKASHRREDKLRLEVEQARLRGLEVQNRLRELEDYNQVILASRSWRLSAPLRWSSRVLRQVRQADRPNLAVGAKPALKRIAMMVERWSRSHPRVRGAMVATVRRMPWLSDRLYRLRHFQVSVESNHEVMLTPRSREIYRQLTEAMEKRKQTDGGQDLS